MYSLRYNQQDATLLLSATASGGSKQAWHLSDAVYTVLELLMMGGETTRNMYRAVTIIKNIV
jgi:hypothetical protein